jgi:predicted rRNA methylase YqxC with S4 and FtsJ domains
MDYKKYHRDKTYEENEDHFKNIFKKRFNIAKKYKKSGQVLDIGASTGVMLDIFKENGWKTVGVEPSQSALIAKNKGHKIIKDYFEKTKLNNNLFDW